MSATTESLYERGLKALAQTIAANCWEIGADPREAYQGLVRADYQDFGLSWESPGGIRSMVRHDGWHLDPADEDRFYAAMDAYTAHLDEIAGR